MNCPNTVTVTVCYEIIWHVFLSDTAHKVHKEFIDFKKAIQKTADDSK